MTSPATLQALLEVRASEASGRVLITCHAEDGEKVTFTAAQLRERAIRVAAGLHARGVPVGAPVVLVLPNGPHCLAAFWGCIAGGFVAVPLAEPPPMGDVRHYSDKILAVAQHLARGSSEGKIPPILVTRALFDVCAGHPRLASLMPHLLAMDTLEAGGAPGWSPTHRARAEDPCLYQFTSGSTGNPKGVILTHDNLVSNCQALEERAKFRASGTMVSWLPLYHDMGLIGCHLGPFWASMPLHLSTPLSFVMNPRSWLERITETRATTTVAPNFAYALAAKRVRQLEGLDLSSLTETCNGAEPIDLRVLRRFTEKFAAVGFRADAMTCVYGLADCTLIVTGPAQRPSVPRVDRVDGKILREQRRAVPSDGEGAVDLVCCGAPVLHTELRIVDEAGQVLPERHVGEIQVKGPGVARGYVHAPEDTAAFLKPGGFGATGDLGYLADGEIFITGRLKDLIILRGTNYYPQDLERAVDEVPGVRAGCAAAFSVPAPGDVDGERVVLFVESALEDAEARAAAVKSAREILLRTFGLAVEVQLVLPGSVPKTTSGKVRRQPCRAEYLKAHESAVTGSASS